MIHPAALAAYLNVGYVASLLTWPSGRSMTEIRPLFTLDRHITMSTPAPSCSYPDCASCVGPTRAKRREFARRTIAVTRNDATKPSGHAIRYEFKNGKKKVVPFFNRKLNDNCSTFQSPRFCRGDAACGSRRFWPVSVEIRQLNCSGAWRYYQFADWCVALGCGLSG